MNPRILLTLLYSLHLIATGLLRGIEAQAYKPNSLWFCIVTGLLIITGAALWQKGRACIGKAITSVVTVLVLSFYFYSFVSSPDKDATLRVGAIILTSIAQMLVVFFPKAAPSSCD